MTQHHESLNSDHDLKLLDRQAILEVFAGLINPTLTDAFRKALVDEIYEHIDAQGRLLARAGNLIARSADTPRDHDERLHVLAAIKRAMS